MSDERGEGSIGEMVSDERSVRRRRWLLGAIGWDGGLPLAVALSPEVLRWLVENRTLAELGSVIGIPMLAGLIRAHHGNRQLEQLGHGANNWRRQLLLGVALILLMVAEAGLALLQIDGGRGPGIDGWVIVGGVYLIYLTLTLMAFRPPDPNRN